jgi:hypothetical protein
VKYTLSGNHLTSVVGKSRIPKQSIAIQLSFVAKRKFSLKKLHFFIKFSIRTYLDQSKFDRSNRHKINPHGKGNWESMLSITIK